MNQRQAATLLLRALSLAPGDLLSGRVINPVVNSLFEREQHNAGSAYVASHRLVPTRSLAEIAAATGEPLYVPRTLGERELAEAQAVLRGAMLDHASVTTGVVPGGAPSRVVPAGAPPRYGASTMPVNAATIAAAADLVGDALSLKQQQKVPA